MANKYENDQAKEYVSYITNDHLRSYLEQTYASLLEARKLSKAWCDKFNESKQKLTELRAENGILKNALSECLDMAEDIDSHGVLQLERKEQVAHFEAMSTKEEK